MADTLPKKKLPKSVVARATVFAGTALSVAVFFVDERAAFFVALISLGSLALFFAGSLRAQASPKPANEQGQNANDHRALVLRQALALNVCDELRSIMHNIKNVLAPLVLDVEAFSEMTADEATQTWETLRPDFIEALDELREIVESAGHVAPPSSSTSLKKSVGIARNQTSIEFVEEGDADLAIDGGHEILAELLVLFACDVQARGGTTLTTTATVTPRRVRVRISDNGEQVPLDPVTIAAARTAALLSGGNADAHRSATENYLELDLFRA